LLEEGKRRGRREEEGKLKVRGKGVEERERERVGYRNSNIY